MTILALLLLIYKMLMLLKPVYLYLPPGLLEKCQSEDGPGGLSILCTNINTTRYLSYIPIQNTQNVVRVDIVNSIVDCLDLAHLSRFSSLASLTVKNSHLKEVLCPARLGRDSSSVNNLKDLLSLDVSSNLLSHLDSRLQVAKLLETLNLSNNRFSHLCPVMASFTNLKYLDLSSNLFSNTLDKNIMDIIKNSLQILDLSGIFPQGFNLCKNSCYFLSNSTLTCRPNSTLVGWRRS